MFDEGDFHRAADRLIVEYADRIEAADEAGVLECDIVAGVLTVKGKRATWVISKHAPSKQIWLASQISGGLHFEWRDGSWQLADGRVLSDVLANELRTHAHIEVEL